MTSKIELTKGAWPLRGASDHAQLLAIVNDLHEHNDTREDTATRTGASIEAVNSVARWYQSLWMHL